VALFRILSIDGGGIRGLLSTLLLRRLIDESSVSDLIARVDMFAGTSSGGLIALGLAAEIPLDEIRDLYLQEGPKIFEENFFDQIRDVGNLLGPQYSNRELRRVLAEIFGDKKLGDLKRLVMVPAFELDNLKNMRPGESRRWKAKIFHNLPNREADKDRLLRDVALYTCSAPTYFPVADGFIDGGVFANNPSVCAIAQALDRRWRRHPSLGDLLLLSIGSGQRIAYLTGDEHHWGVVQWGARIMPILMEGSQETTHFQCAQLLGDSQYCRVQPVFQEDYRMDSVHLIAEMMDFALNSVNLTTATDWISLNWQFDGWMRFLRQNPRKRKIPKTAA
jgi:patatin-like phospholipase/acyl hydrolase